MIADLDPTSAVQILSAGLGAGIIVFWASVATTGRLTRESEPWPGFRHHELAFALPDLCLAALLIAASVFPADSGLIAIAGGALGFLGLVDGCYCVATWRLRTVRQRVWSMLVSVTAIAGAIALVVLSR